MVIDRSTGTTPPSAAERMAEHDRRMGHEPAQPMPRAEPRTPQADPPPRMPAPDHRVAAAVADRNRRQPWGEKAAGTAGRKGKPPVAASPSRKAPPASPSGGPAARKTIVTGKWWDAKGPRTIELGPKGQQVLGSGFVTLFVAVMIAAIVTLVIQPLLLFVAAFLLIRFGGKVLGPLGAGIVDKAVAERN